jgi:hypothetical protein
MVWVREAEKHGKAEKQRAEKQKHRKVKMKRNINPKNMPKTENQVIPKNSAPNNITILSSYHLVH